MAIISTNSIGINILITIIIITAITLTNITRTITATITVTITIITMTITITSTVTVTITITCNIPVLGKLGNRIVPTSEPILGEPVSLWAPPVLGEAWEFDCARPCLSTTRRALPAPGLPADSTRAIIKC